MAAVERGYLKISRTWAAGDRVSLVLPMAAVRVYAHPDVRQDIGRVALQRGPLIYCLEQHDNSAPVNRLRLPAGTQLQDVWRPDLLGGVVVVSGAVRAADAAGWGKPLYRGTPPTESESMMTGCPIASGAIAVPTRRNCG